MSNVCMYLYCSLVETQPGKATSVGQIPAGALKGDGNGAELRRKAMARLVKAVA